MRKSKISDKVGMAQRAIKRMPSASLYFTAEAGCRKQPASDFFLSLFQYRYLRVPDYQEAPLIEHLKKDFKKFYVELQAQTKREPNNLTLNRIMVFFDIHYQQLKQISEGDMEKDSEQIL